MTKNSFLLLAVAIPFLRMGAGCATQGTDNLGVGDNTSTAPSVTVTNNQTATNIFHPFKNKVGDVVAGLTVVSVGPVPGISFPLSMDDVDAKFSGSVTLSGTYDYSFSDFSGQDMACFAISDPKEKIKLPQLYGVDDQNSRFCFSNLQKAKEVFGPTYGSGHATITIDHYELTYAPAEVFNQAQLLNAIAISKTTASITPWATRACGVNHFETLNQGRGLKVSGQFQGVDISVIAKNYLALSGSQADALTAVTSTDGRELVVAYVSCDGATGQDVRGTTPDKHFSLDGTVVHLIAFTGSDATTGHYLARLPTFSGSNFGAMFLPVGFMDQTYRVLVSGEIYDMGAGGSCATTYWMTIDATTAATTHFSTDPVSLVYNKNTHIVYGPNSCGSLTDIRIKNVLTGSDQLIKKLNGDAAVNLQKIEEQNVAGTQTRFILHYTVYNPSSDNGAPATMVLP